MLSEEEIIKGITNIIYTCNEVIEDEELYDQEEIESVNEQLKFTEGLLDLYYKRQEEIEVLKKDLDKKVKALDIAMSNPDYICKDKIRKKLNYFEHSFDYDDDGTSYELVIEVLDELLEEN